MRVITGTARGRKLKTPIGYDVRPTSDQVKEAIFNIVQFDVEGRRVLDLFGGTGQMGIEALSRGAAKCTFVDADSKAVAVIKSNLEHTKLADMGAVAQMDAFSFLRMSPEVFDVVILDPPYGVGLLQKALASLDGKLAEGALIVCEFPAKEELPENAGGLSLFKRYKYGKTELAVYR